MKLIINIPNELEAGRFLNWMLHRGDITLGSVTSDGQSDLGDRIFIFEAYRMREDAEERRDTKRN